MSEIKVEELSSDTLDSAGVFSWPIWEKEVSTFDWTYEAQEQCYFLEGLVKVRTAEGVTEIKKGDFVTFPKGLSCQWQVEQPVKKHYCFKEG